MGREREEDKWSMQHAQHLEEVKKDRERREQEEKNKERWKERWNAFILFIPRNFFQICVVLLLAWIGWNLELVVDSSDSPLRNFMEDIMRSYLDTDFNI